MRVRPSASDRRWWPALLAVTVMLLLPVLPSPGAGPPPPGSVLVSGHWPPGAASGGPEHGRAWAAVEPPPQIHAAAGLLMDWETGQVLFQRNGFVRRAPASTTKVLTAILALERGRLDDRVTVSANAARTRGSSMYLRAGETLTLDDLLHGLLLNSGNDAAMAIAEHLAGSVEQFAGWMNEKAAAIGARSSRFVNPHGLHHPGHYSTAYDLALITRYALRHPQFAAIVRRQEAELLLGESSRALRNTNKLLWMFEGADGVKTGTTSAAGACLISSATRSDRLAGRDHKLVAVVLNTRSRWHDSVRLLEWGYNQFRLQALADPGEVIGYVPVTGGRDAWVGLTAGARLAAVLPRREPVRPDVRITVPAAVPAPVAAGQAIGTVEVWAGDQAQVVAPLVAARAVGPATIATRLARPAVPWLHRLRRWGLLD